MPAITKETVDSCCQQIRWSDLDLDPIQQLVNLAIAEDTRGAGLAQAPETTGDPTSQLLSADQSLSATLHAREPLTLCGVELLPLIAQSFDSELTIHPIANDGDSLPSGAPIATLSGPTRSALTAERTLLNFLQRLSGIATTTRAYADALEDSSTRLLDTRKTTPGYRVLEKFAVACGGGWNHRIGLFDRVMLKDNHLAAFGDDFKEATRAAVAASRQRSPHLLVEMEVDRTDQIDAALDAQVDIILLDNFSLEDLATAQHKINRQAVTEISGNVTLDTIPTLKTIGCDFISTGALVHKSVWVDIGLDSD